MRFFNPQNMSNPISIPQYFANLETQKWSISICKENYILWVIFLGRHCKCLDGRLVGEIKIRFPKCEFFISLFYCIGRQLY